MKEHGKNIVPCEQVARFQDVYNQFPTFGKLLNEKKLWVQIGQIKKK
jgi:hypothetical protein